MSHTVTRTPQRRESLNESTVWQVYARSIYDEFTWVEMVIVPRETIISVIES